MIYDSANNLSQNGTEGELKEEQDIDFDG